MSMNGSSQNLAPYNENNAPQQLIPILSAKELYQLTQMTDPVSELIGKKFEIVGIIPERVEIIAETGSLETKLRYTLITNIGSYHSFSITLNAALLKAVRIFGEGILEQTFTLSTKTKNSKTYYVLGVD